MPAAKKVKPIPDGYHTITPHLVVASAAKAIDFYKKAFAAEEIMRMPGPDGAIMHAEVCIGDSRFMLGEENANSNCKGPLALGGSPTSFYIYVQDVDKAWKRATDAGAKIKMPLADMFWGDRVGYVEDPFGHVWSLAQHTRDLTPEEMKTGHQEFMARMKQQHHQQQQGGAKKK